MRRVCVLLCLCLTVSALFACGSKNPPSSSNNSSVSIVKASSALSPSSQEQVQKAYIAYYGRPADPSGLAYWGQRLDASGGDWTPIIEAFGNSTEATTLLSGLTNEQKIDKLYNQMLGRDADSTGRAFYANGLSNGTFTLASLAVNIINGVNGANTDATAVANKLAAARLFTSGLDSDTKVAAYNGSTLPTIKNWFSSVVATTAETASVSSLITNMLATNEAAQQVITPGTLELHTADSQIIWSWYSYVPRNISKSSASYILLCGMTNNDLTGIEDKSIITSQTLNSVFNCRTYGDQHNYIVLTPVIPYYMWQTPNGLDYYYTVAFNRNTLLSSTDSFYTRADLKVNQMVDRLQSILRYNGYNVQDKVFVEGFSAGGMFSQIYTLLHPERVKAAAIGQAGGSLVLPVSSYNGITLDWRVGINDFETLFGYRFNDTAYKQVPQFVYLGDQDNADMVKIEGLQTAFTNAQVAFLNQTFGSTPATRVAAQVNYMQQSGYNNISIKIYPGVAHRVTTEMRNDIFSFFNAYR